jgi:adenylate kinase family enzyme/phosphoribosyl-ATP pyrophosphohydrolase
MMTIIGLLGEPGSGKSTVCRTLSNLGYPTFHTGAVMKRLIASGEVSLNEVEGQFAPEQIDEKIYQRIAEMVNLNIKIGNDSLIIDTFPRSEKQIDWINRLVEDIDGVEFKFCLITASRRTRIDRMQNRNQNRKDFDSKRGYDDGSVMAIFEWLTLNFDTTTFDSERMDAEHIANCINFIISKKDERPSGLRSMYVSALNCHDEHCGYAHRPDPIRMIDRMIEECNELKTEIIESGTASTATSMEYADILHFAMCLAEALGLSPDSIYDIFKEKTKINQARLHFGRKEGIVDGKL